MMTKREERVINAFVTCVKSGEFTEEYATILIEDTQKYGWLSDYAKEEFYRQIAEEEVIEEEIPAEEVISEEPLV